MLKNIFFDLDGTLLPINQTTFIKAYFTELAKKVVPLGYDKDGLINAVWAGTGAMMQNNGVKTNREVFWENFTAILGEKAAELESIIDGFYSNEFDSVKSIQFDSRDNKALVNGLREKGYRVVLATSPIFPIPAIRTRLSWINLTFDDFDGVTTYENSHFGKPNPGYYQEILERFGAKAEETLMIGNNPAEDMCFEKLGGRVYLVTDDIENPDGMPTDCYERGSFGELKEFLAQLPEVK